MTINNLFMRISFFIASFFPLWGIMLFLASITYEFKNYGFVYVGIILLIVLCLSQVRIQIRNYKTNAENPQEIIIKSRTETTREYVFAVIPYLFVVTSIDMQFENIVVLLSVFFIIGVLYIRTNMVLTNPMFLLLGFRIFEITYVELHNQNHEKTTLLLTKKSPWHGDEMTIEEIARGIHLESN